MSHQDMAFSLHKTATIVKSNCVGNSKLNDNELCRVIYSRLYYALYHKYLNQDNALSSNTDPSKHQKIMAIVNTKCKVDSIKILYKKLHTLRIWADYQLEDHVSPGATIEFRRIDILLSQVYKTIQLAKIV